MAFDSLKRFMVERLLDLDSSLSDAAGSEVYTKVIDPLISRLGVDPKSVDVETFITRRLLDEFPELDIESPGSVIRDVFVAPLVLLLEPLQREVEFLRVQSSLADAESLSTEEMDALLSNVFATRNAGSYSYGMVRVYFTNPSTITVSPLVNFSTSAGIVFVPDGVATYEPADYTRAGDLYYVDVPVRSILPEADANVDRNEIRYVTGLQNVSRVVNLSTTTGGVAEETNEAFITRAERSLSERSLNTRRGIETAIFDNFAAVTSVDVIGFGEAGMDRDIIQAAVDVDVDEAAGPIIYSSSEWRTHAAATFTGAAGATELPFTNTLVLSPSGVAWDAAVKVEILNSAKFVRVSDGSHKFDSSVLGRVREVASVEEVGADLYIKLKDFEVYPQTAAHTITSQVTATQMRTDSADHGYNAHAAQGSQWKLLRDDDDITYVAGAPLPSTDHLRTSFVATEVPAAVIPGRDFLLTASKATYSAIGANALGRNLAKNVRVHPLARFFSSDDLGVGRTDGFLMSRTRSAYTGKTDFVFDPDATKSMLNETVTVVGFGGPDYSSHPDETGKYDGQTVGAAGRAPGVSLTGIVPGPQIVDPAECVLTLHGSQPSWAAQGAVNGDFVSCALFSSSFTGTLTTASAEMLWQGWGRIAEVGYQDPRRVRMVGLDWTPLSENNLDSFNPPAAGTISVGSVPTTLAAGHASAAATVAFAGAVGPFTLDVLPFAVAWGTGDGGESSAVRATANITIDQAWAIASVATVSFGNQHLVTLQNHASAALAATALANHVTANVPNVTASANLGTVVVTHSFYGASWSSLSLQTAGAAGALVSAPATLGGGVDPTAAQTAREIAHQIRTLQGPNLDAYTTPIGSDTATTVWVEAKAAGSAGNTATVTIVQTGNHLSFAGWDNNTELGGGFSYGFGPLLPVSGESLTAAPVPNAVHLGFTFTLANTPVKAGSVTLTRSPGPGQITDNGDGTLAGTGGGSIDYTTGQIVVTYAAAPAVGDSWSAAYSYERLPFRLHWTVYRGSSEGVHTTGDLYRSYTDLALLPAYKPVGGSGLVHSRQSSGYNSAGWGSWGDLDYTGRGGAYGTPASDTARTGVWFRLGRTFEDVLPSLGKSGVAASPGAEAVLLDSRIVGNLTEPVGSEKYTKARYEGAVVSDFDGDAANDTVLVQPVALPWIEGERRLSGVGGASPTADVTFAGLTNSKAAGGFLLPHPMGPKSYAVLNNAAWNHDPATGDQALDSQTVQLFGASVSPVTSAAIVVSGMPGSVPFPDQFAGDFVVRSGEIHIGGMTDVYIKQDVADSTTTSPIKLQPEAIVGTASGEVLLAAEDGVIDADNDQGSVFASPDLVAYLAGQYGAHPQPVADLAIELLNPASGITPTFFRVRHSVSTGVVISGTFTEEMGRHENVRFRLLSGCTTSLANPLILLQQGGDLTAVKNAMSVEIPTGLVFVEDPALIQIFVSIDSGDAKGEYQVAAKSGSVLTLSTAVPASGTALPYRVYTKQAAGITLPFTRVTAVLLDDDATNGIAVPYRHPVDAVSSDFAGLNDDPLTGASLGAGTLSNETVGGEVVACFTTTEDLQLQGTLKFDVLRLDNVDAPNQHWYVTAFQSVPVNATNYTNNRLVLDRAAVISTDVSTSQYTLGHPSVGTSEVVFLDRTFFEVGPDAVFSYTNSAGQLVRFRPSPAEEAVLYQSTATATNAKIFSNDGAAVKFTADDLLSYGTKPGDYIEVISRVLTSSVFDGTDPTLAHENVRVSGKTLVVRVDGAERSVTFTGTNPLTLSEVAADINRQLSGDVRAEVLAEANSQYYLTFNTIKRLELLSTGSIGILANLHIDSTDLKKTDNTYYGEGQSDLIDRFEITQVTYTAGDAQPYTIRFTPVLVLTTNEAIFVRVVRPKFQRTYPAGMAEYGGGLFSTKVTLTSYDPNASGGLVGDRTQLSVEGHTSFGYEYVTNNKDYSYSSAEDTSIRVTAIMLDEFADSMNDRLTYALPAANVTIEYDLVSTVDGVQNYLLQPSVRVVCNNPLARHFFPAYPVLDISYSGAISEDAVLDTVKAYLSTLYPNAPLEVFDLTTLLGRNGATYVTFPQEAAFIVHDETRVIRIERSRDRVLLDKRWHVMEDVSRVNITRIA
jgi:hypothetical protein